MCRWAASCLGHCLTLPVAMGRAVLTPPLVLQVKAPRLCLRGTSSTTMNGTR